MGIFGDIFEGLGDIARGPIGQAVGGRLLERFLPLPQFPGPISFPRAPAPAPVPQAPLLAPGPVVLAGGGPFGGAPFVDPASLGGGPPMPGVFQTAGIIQQQPREPSFLDPGCPSFFRAGGMTARPTRFITATNPATGALTFWEHAGQPIMFSRDLAVCKRVRRIAGKAGTVARRRTSRRKR